MIIFIVSLFIIILVAVIAIRTMQFKPIEQVNEATTEVYPPNRVVENLSKVVQFKTISYPNPEEMDMAIFEQLRDFLKQAYPLFHRELTTHLINGATLIYHWKGKDSAVKPVLFTAHQDVVPAKDESQWDVGAFSGAVKDGFVWGRGTLDTKIQIVTIMEAVEDLLEKGTVPSRDIYFAFGHDEEQNGKNGAKKAAEWFAAEGITFEYMLDEGGVITEGALDGVDKPVAVIGTCEKGYMNIKLSAKSKPGHASQPPKKSAIGVLAQAVIALEKNPMPFELSETVKEMLKKTGPHMGLVNRIVIANLWLFKALFMRIFSGSNIGNAMLRTTMAMTMAEGSDVPNVIPQTASVTINIRNAPSSSTAEVIDYIKRTINNEEITVTPLYLLEPSPISQTEAVGYKAIESVINEIAADAIVTPYLMVAGTDSAKYVELTENTYRFAPYRVSAEDLGRIHGNNERISIENIVRCVVFYQKLFTRI
jgi:carboxypeptidase PM20D1